MALRTAKRLDATATPDPEAQKDALFYALQHVEGFALYFVVCDPARTRPQLMDELTHRLQPKSVERVAVPRETHNLLHLLQKHLPTPPPDILFIYGLEHQIYGSAKPRSHRLLLNLNATRNNLATEVPRPLVFFVPVHVMNALLQGAPDFFSVRSGIYTFALTPEERKALARELMERDWISIQGISASENDADIQRAENLLATYRALTPMDRSPWDEASLLTYLGMVYHSQGQYVEAEEACVDALEILEKSLPANHVNIADVWNNLGNVYSSQGRYVQAEESFKTALRILEKVLPANHVNIGQTWNNLGNVYYHQDRYMEAKEAFQKALEIYGTALPTDHVSVGNTWNNIGNLYEAQGWYIEAEEAYKTALRIKEVTLPANHVSIGQTWNNIGNVYQLQSRYTEAEEAYNKALAILEKGLGKNHPLRNKVIRNIRRLEAAASLRSGAE